MRYAFSRNPWNGRRLVLFLGLIGLFVFQGLALARGDTSSDRHFLWSMEANGNTYYFLGSLHVMKRDVYPLAAEIEKAYRDCERIVLETNPESLLDPGLQQKFLSAGLLPEGRTLKQTVSPTTYDLFRGKLDELGLTVTLFDRFRPWFCAVNLAVLAYQKLGFDSSYGIDLHFFQRAKRDGKELIYLEPPEYQIDLFNELGRLQPDATLRRTLEEIDLLEELAPRMLQAWLTGDEEGLDVLIKKSFDEFPEMYDRLFTQRNKRWGSRIERLAREKGNALVIVGAGHLTGDQSVFDFLRPSGYRIIQE